MFGTNRLVRGSLVLCLGATMAHLRAQETGFSKDLKFRQGYTSSPKDHLRAPYSGFGLDLGYGIGFGRVGVELGYFYKTGDNYFTAPDASRLPGGALPMNPAKSVEDKRNELSGFSVRLSFSRALAADWRWQAGVQLGTRFHHQYVGDCQSTPWDAASGNAAWRDLYLDVADKRGLNPSLYGGVAWKMDKDSSLEFNLVFLNYQSIEYHHFAGTASSYDTGDPGRRSSANAVFPFDYLETHRRLVPHVELAYVFHF